MSVINRFIDLEREFCSERGIELTELRKAYDKFIKYLKERAYDPKVTALFLHGFGTLQFTLNSTRRYVAMCELKKDYDLRDKFLLKLDLIVKIITKKVQQGKKIIRENAKPQQYNTYGKNKTKKDNPSNTKEENKSI